MIRLSPQHFCIYVSVLSSPIGHISDYDQSASVFLAGAMPPPYQTSTLLPSNHKIFWSAAASERAAVRGGAAAQLRDTWQVLQLWSVFCKESLTAENAAVSGRFIAQSLQSVSPTGFFLRVWGDRDVFSRTLSITVLFISFSNKLTLTSADSMSGV